VRPLLFTLFAFVWYGHSYSSHGLVGYTSGNGDGCFVLSIFRTLINYILTINVNNDDVLFDEKNLTHGAVDRIYRCCER